LGDRHQAAGKACERLKKLLTFDKKLID